MNLQIACGLGAGEPWRQRIRSKGVTSRFFVSQIEIW